MEEDFEKLIGKAVEDLPGEIRQKLENIAIVIEEKPTQEQLKKLGVRMGEFLLGLYEGVPQISWGKGFGGYLPDKITIFKESIKKFAGSPEEIKNIVKKVVLHEIGHHFGFNEKEIRELEKKW